MVDVVLAVGAALGGGGLLGGERPLLELAADGVAAAAGRGGVGAAGQAGGQVVGEVGGDAGGGPRVDGDGVPVDVVEGVAGEVVAGVGRGAGAGEDAGGGDAELEEADVVGAGAEAAERGGLALGGDVVVEGLGAEPVARVVAEVDVVDRVDGADHVVVPVEADGVGLGLGQVGGVVEGADEAALLGAPPDEADLVLEAAVLLEGAGDLEQGRGAAAVVVDAGAGLDAVEVGAQHDDVVRVALLGLGDDVPRLALVPDGVDEEVHLERLAGGQARPPGGGVLEGHEAHGHQQAQVLGAQGGRANVAAGGLVVQDDADGAGRLGQLELVGDGADAALDEGELAGGVDALPLVGEAAGTYHTEKRERKGSVTISSHWKGHKRIVVCLTSGIINGGVDERGRVAAGQGGRVVVLEAHDVDILAVGTGDAELAGLGEGVVEVLQLGVELLVEAALDALEDVVGRGLVAGQAKGTVAAVVTGDLVQVPEVAFKSGDSLGGLDVGLGLIGGEGVSRQGPQREQGRGEGGGGLHRGRMDKQAKLGL
ncbi:hypothetical protein CTA1_1340 [Colletotrichum tanaceti]|uniref:Uncharacterized protein n=1 Tax=Colletotrichum tanaceti TaxID=1306861 RepID=A0A4U6X2C5_9PEZI|nr:hypothetical protein CTA1_1340 [Colletotrichum tanaceti]